MINDRETTSIWLTISIGVYNSEKYFRDCLQSIVGEKVEFSYEIVITNDGSTDGTQEIITEFVDEYPGIIKLISQENKGQGSSYNNGIREAEGRYIMFVDGDDMLDMRELESVYKKTKGKDHDIILHNSYMFAVHDIVENAGNTADHGYCKREVAQQLSEGEYEFADIWDKCLRLIHNNIFLVQFLRKNEINADETYKYGADAILEVRVSAYAKTVLCIHNKPYHYRVNEAQITDVKKLDRMLDDRIGLLSSAVHSYSTMIEKCEQKDLRFGIIRKSICNIAGIAYVAAYYSKNIHSNISKINRIMKHEKDIWNSRNRVLRIASSNLFILYPVFKVLIWMRYKRITTV